MLNGIDSKNPESCDVSSLTLEIYGTKNETISEPIPNNIVRFIIVLQQVYS
jgi:hypothetical protein